MTIVRLRWLGARGGASNGVPHEELEQRWQQSAGATGLGCSGAWDSTTAARGVRSGRACGAAVAAAQACCVVSFCCESSDTAGEEPAVIGSSHYRRLKSTSGRTGSDAAFQPVVNGVYGLVSSTGR
jgi:hypothetical protein